MTAAREATAIRPTDAVGGRGLVAGGLLCVVILALGLRLVPVIFVPSLNWGDEVFQTVEPARRLVYGYGLMTWEFQVGMRPWLVPGALAGVIELARLFGEGPDSYLTAIALALGLLACAPLVCCFLWGRRWDGLAGGFVAAAAVAIAPELVYFGARALNDVIAGHVLLIAAYLLHPGDPVGDRRRLFAVGMLLGLVCLLRLQLAPAAALIALWPSAPDWRSRLVPIIAGGVLAGLFGAAIDWLTLGYPLASIWRNFFYNIYLGVSSEFSVEPWFYYPLGELAIWAVATPLLLFLIGLGARRLPVLLAAAAVVFAVHMAIPHKEYRFVYAAVVMLMALAAIGLAQVVRWLARLFSGRSVRPAVATAIGATLVLGWWSAVSYGAWSSGTLAGLRERAHDELVAMRFVRGLPGVCGVGLHGEEAWVRYGGYSHLHRPLPMFWPKDAAELAAGAAGFDTLLYDGTEPPDPAFAPLRCFGGICVGRRPGGCETRPLPATWFPERLGGSRPTTPGYEPVPPAMRRAAGAERAR